ncbi:MAG: response regulator transcription factor [Saprospiraceae bacterium]|nr:response regulator transcription factor [Saprospiraceae bacterium]
MAIRTVIADYQRMFAEGIQALLSDVPYPPLKVLGVAHSIDEVEKMSFMGIDLLIVELAMAEKSESSLLGEMKRKFPAMRIIVLSNYGDSALVREAFKQGADGYVLKSHHILELIQCIDAVMTGKTYMAEGLRLAPELKRVENQNDVESKKLLEDSFLLRQKLTRREREILSLIVQFKNNKAIAQELFISDQTVIAHRKRIMKKLGVNNSVNLIKISMDHQLV